MTLLFVVIGGNAVGFGHLSRCLAIAEHAATRSCEIAFLLFGDDDASERVRQRGYRTVSRPIGELGRGGAELPPDHAAADSAIVDLSYSAVAAEQALVLDLLTTLRSRVGTIALIDAMGVHALGSRAPDGAIDLLVVPYLGAGDAGSPAGRALLGPAYCALSPAYLDLPERAVRQDADRLLVSCGGSDPQHLSLVVMAALDCIASPLHVRVVVGPLFEDALTTALTDAAARSRHHVSLVRNPAALTEHMQWCDVALATSGLTKYELAATSTPAILLSLGETDVAVNRPFAAAETTRDLGIERRPEPIAKSITSLLNNHAERRRMAEAGRRLVDGRGAERVVTEILRSMPC